MKNRVHVDLGTADLESELKRLAGLGATHIADLDEGGTRWTTLADPEGNEFDVAQTGGSAAPCETSGLSQGPSE